MASAFGEHAGALSAAPAVLAGRGERPETTLTGFARAVRAAGVPVTQDRTQSFLRAVSAVGITDRHGVYWSGRATLCAEPDHFPLYDKVFEAWFAGVLPRLSRVTSNAPARNLPPVQEPDGRSSGEDRTQDVELI